MRGKHRVLFAKCLLDFSSQFIGVFIISTADYSFELLVLISAVRKTKKSLKNWRIAVAYHETSGNYDKTTFETII